MKKRKEKEDKRGKGAGTEKVRGRESRSPLIQLRTRRETQLDVNYH
jgi:hypothetical protein